MMFSVLFTAVLYLSTALMAYPTFNHTNNSVTLDVAAPASTVVKTSAPQPDGLAPFKTMNGKGTDATMDTIYTQAVTVNTSRTRSIPRPIIIVEDPADRADTGRLVGIIFGTVAVLFVIGLVIVCIGPKNLKNCCSKWPTRTSRGVHELELGIISHQHETTPSSVEIAQSGGNPVLEKHKFEAKHHKTTA
jgi:uncharacterized protein (UPF0333 family)